MSAAESPPTPPGRTGSATPKDAGTGPGEEPVVIGALFISMVLLILIAGGWAVMFRTLMER